SSPGDALGGPVGLSRRNWDRANEDPLMRAGLGRFEVASASHAIGDARQFPRPFGRNLLQEEALVTNAIESLVGRVGGLESAAVAARKTADESAAEGYFREA